MTSLDQAVAKCIRQFPSLFRNRTDVLHHFFCVNGNGMEWVNGELTGDDDGPEQPITESPDPLAEIDPISLSPSLHRISIAMAIERRYDALTKQFRRDNADDLAQASWRTSRFSWASSLFSPKPIYPLCQYACMNEVPDDVKPDWLAGVREMIFAVFDAPIEKHPQRTLEEHQAAQNKNIAFASEVLSKLAIRFGNPNHQPVSYAEWIITRSIAQDALRSLLD